MTFTDDAVSKIIQDYTREAGVRSLERQIGAICRKSVVKIVEEAARRNGATRVAVVHVEIGGLSHVEPEALAFAFDAVARGGLAAGARLDIHRTAGVARCMACDEPVRLARLGDACPRCGGYQLEVTGGDEMRVRDIEIA